MITFVYAQDHHGGIGYQQQLPWYLPSELQYFKRITMGHAIVMGRKTFESMNQRLLPDRRTIVITRDQDYSKEIPNLTVVTSIDPILELSKREEVMVIGGAQIFDLFDKYVDKIYRTLVDGEFQVDTFVKDIDPQQWQLIEQVEGDIDQANHYPHRYQTWIRRK